MHHNDHQHTHDHDHDLAHAHDHSHAHDNSHNDHNEAHGHDNLLSSKNEAAAFLQYTLHHNEHHEEELSDLAHSLEHLELTAEAQQVRLCIEDIERANKRLEQILSALK